MFRKEVFGLVQDTLDPRDVWEDEVLAGDDVEIPSSFRTEGLIYEPQGGYPYCVAFAATTMAEIWYNKATGGARYTFSQPHLFFHSGGTKLGSSFRENLNTLVKKGAISYEKLPMPNATIGKPKDWYENEKAKALSTPFNDAKMVGGFVRVQSDPESLKRAVMRYGALLVGVAAGSGDYYKGNGTRVKSTDNHAVLLVGWTPTHWVIFDSLWWVKANKGYGTLNISYTFNSAYTITSLPENWKELRDEARENAFQGALQHYGKANNHEAEVMAANDILKALKKWWDAPSYAVAGKFWTTLCCMVAYGGYSITYTKYGKEHAGDILNFLYHYARTGEFIFDVNKTREENSK